MLVFTCAWEDQYPPFHYEYLDKASLQTCSQLVNPPIAGSQTLILKQHMYIYIHLHVLNVLAESLKSEARSSGRIKLIVYNSR